VVGVVTWPRSFGIAVFFVQKNGWMVRLGSRAPPTGNEKAFSEISIYKR